MINLNKTNQVADIIHGTILYSGLEGAIIRTPIFNRLHHILQSSLVGLTYSSNKVKRFEHSLGVMHLAGEMFYKSFNNTNDNELVSGILIECNEAIKEWFKKLDITNTKGLQNSYADLYNESNITKAPIPKSSLYLEKLPHIVGEENKYAYLVLFEATRIAGLLHDVGHLPYSHIFEYTINNLYGKVKNVKKPTKLQKSFLNIVKEYCETDGKTEKKEFHEELGLQLVSQIKKEIMEELEQQQNEVNFFVLIVLDFALEILKSKNCDNTLFSDVHKIIAGVVDADRLDYCTRDLYCSGVSKDIFPYQRLLSNYKLVRKRLQLIDTEENDRERVLFCPAIKNIEEIEDLLDRRWKIFTKINFHHRVHKHEIIFSEILAGIGFQELLDEEDELGKIIPGQPLKLALTSIWQLVENLQSGKSLIDYYIIQLDDGWMDTLLKVAFFTKYNKNYRNEEINSKDPLWNKFDELISARPHYFTAYKRSTMLFEFDKRLGDTWLTYIKDKKSNALINRVSEYIKLNNKPVNTNFSKMLAFVLDDTYVGFYNDIENSLNELLENELANANIKNCMIRPCRIDIGFTESAPICFWQEKDGKDICVLFEEVSSKRNLLKLSKESNIPFHLYYLPKNKSAQINLDILEKRLIDLIVIKLYELAFCEKNN